MKLGIGSYAYGWAVGVPGWMPEAPMTAFELLDRAEALAVEVVQIADNLPLDRLPAAERAALRARAGAGGLRIEVGTRGIDLNHLRTYLDLALQFESPLVRLVIDTAGHTPGEDEVVQTLRPLLPDYERAGVRLAIENHDRFTAAALARLLRRLDSPAAGVCLDTANSFGAGEGVRTVAETLAPWIVNLHVKDYAVTRLPHAMGFTIEGRPAGQGALDLPWLLAFVRACGPANAILELWPPPEPSIEVTLAKEAAWVDASIRYLRRLVPASRPSPSTDHA